MSPRREEGGRGRFSVSHASKDLSPQSDTVSFDLAFPKRMETFDLFPFIFKSDLDCSSLDLLFLSSVVQRFDLLCLTMLDECVSDCNENGLGSFTPVISTLGGNGGGDLGLFLSRGNIGFFLGRGGLSITFFFGSGGGKFGL